MRPETPVRIVGIADTPVGKHPDETTLTLGARVAGQALADAGLDWAAVDGLIVLTPMVGAFPRHGLAVAEALGISSQLNLADAMALGGSSPLAALAAASRAIRAGDCETVVIIGADVPRTGQDRAESVRYFAQQRHPDWEQPAGLTNVASYGLLASRYLAEFGLGPDALLEFPLLLRAHAQRTGTAAYRTPLTREEVAASRPVADPLRLLECSPISDGAAGLVVSRHRTGSPAVELAGYGFASDYDSISYASYASPDGRSPATRSLEAASRTAGFGTADLDLAMVYDSYSIALALQLEGLGISAPGASTADAAAGRFRTDGDLPLNPHGGLLSHGHCGGAAGIHHVVELVKQLRGAADNQVDVRRGLALCQAEGGILSANMTALFSRSELN